MSGKSTKERVVVKARRNLIPEDDGNPRSARVPNECSETEKGSGKGNRNSRSDRRKRKSNDNDSETITVVADVHTDGDGNNQSSHMGDFLNVMFTESNETIEGKDLVNVMNRFADEMSKNQQKYRTNVG